jgi:hypothetical protein
MKFLADYPGVYKYEGFLDSPLSCGIAYKMQRSEDGHFRYAFEIRGDNFAIGGSFIPLDRATCYEEAETRLRQMLHSKLAHAMDSQNRGINNRETVRDKIGSVEPSIVFEISKLVENPVDGQSMRFEWQRWVEVDRVQVELAISIFSCPVEIEIMRKSVRWDLLQKDRESRSSEARGQESYTIARKEDYRDGAHEKHDYPPDSGFAALI